MPGHVIEADRSDAALAEACRQAGLDGAGAILLRRGTNAVYRLPSARVIVRVSPDNARLEEIERQVSVARWLAGCHVPAVEVLDVDQPIRAEGHLVTLWVSINDGGADDLDQYGDTAELGHALRKLHAAVQPDDLVLPELDPFGKAERHLASLGHLEDDDRRFLAQRAELLEARYRGLRYELTHGAIHGDANVGNLLRTREGTAVLADLDSFSVGQREWDLVLTAMFVDRYGWHTEDEYGAFVEAYGYDLRQWDGYEVLADVRELLMVLWNAGNAARSEEHAAELGKRLESLRTGRGRAEWSPL